MVQRDLIVIIGKMEANTMYIQKMFKTCLPRQMSLWWISCAGFTTSTSRQNTEWTRKRGPLWLQKNTRTAAHYLTKSSLPIISSYNFRRHACHVILKLLTSQFGRNPPCLQQHFANWAWNPTAGRRVLFQPLSAEHAYCKRWRYCVFGKTQGVAKYGV